MKLNSFLLVFVLSGGSTAHAVDATALAQSDSHVQAVIGLAPILTLNCMGVNAGIWFVDKYTAYLGKITVAAGSNASTAPTTVVQQGVYFSQAATSTPTAGFCQLSGVSNLNIDDYKLSLSSNTDLDFVAGTSSDVMNPLGQKPPALTGIYTGLRATLNVVSETPNLELDGSLYWRIGAVIDVDAFRIPGFATFVYGGFKTNSPATADVYPSARSTVP
jgi:hypothetical protein